MRNGERVSNLGSSGMASALPCSIGCTMGRCVCNGRYILKVRAFVMQ
jgi:hypothetical protein